MQGCSESLNFTHLSVRKVSITFSSIKLTNLDDYFSDRLVISGCKGRKRDYGNQLSRIQSDRFKNDLSKIIQYLTVFMHFYSMCNYDHDHKP